MGQENRRPTLKTIAKLTGLAVPTVSRALNDSDEIGAATRDRVKKIAAEIGYVPNRAGVRLRTGRSYVVALLLSADSEALNFTARFIKSIAKEMRSTRYNLTINPYFRDEDPLNAVRRVVETHAADAIILNQTEYEDPRVKYLMDRGFPFVTHGRTRWSDTHDYYDFDNRAVAETAVEALAAKGRSNLLLVAPPHEQHYSQDMMQGFEARTAQLQLRGQVARNFSTDSPSELVKEQIASILSSGPRIDGVVCGSALSCLEVTSALESNGMAIGTDFDVFSKDAGLLLKRFRSEIMTIHEDPWNAGRFVANAVLERAEKPDAPLMQELERPGEAQTTN